MYQKFMEANNSDDTVEGSNMVQLQAAQGTSASPPAGAKSPSSLIKVHPLLGPGQSTVECPFCHQCVMTTTKNTTTTRTHRLAFKCLLFCCCCLPYCMDSAQNIDHFCPSCKRYLGTYEK